MDTSGPVMAFSDTGYLSPFSAETLKQPLRVFRVPRAVHALAYRKTDLSPPWSVQSLIYGQL